MINESSKLLSLTFILNCLYSNIANETSVIVSLSHFSAVTKQSNEVTRNRVMGKKIEELKKLKSFQNVQKVFETDEK